MKKLLTVLLIFSLFLFSACDKEVAVSYTVNPDIIKSESFSLQAAQAGLATFANGSLFLQESAEGRKVLLTASIEIDEKDSYGISFYFGEGWKIAEIYSDYPQAEDMIYAKPDFSTASIYSKDAPDALAETENPSEHIAVWFTADDSSEWKQRAAVKAAGGGSGSIIIELLPEGEKTADLKMLLAMGSAEKDGIRIIETDGLELTMEMGE